MEKGCLIINFWFGDRRRSPPIYNEDRLIYIKTQIEYLRLYQNNLKTIYFNFNVETEHYDLLNKALKLVPKYINGSEIITNIRGNKDFSYGAWNDITLKEIENYEYFIYLEDDYFFTQDNWDEYLIRKYNTKEDIGFLSMGVRPHHNPHFRFLFHSIGISSRKSLKKVIENSKDLIGQSSYEENNYHSGESLQNIWGRLYSEVGLINYDVREDYQVEFGLTDRPEDVWRLWEWNKNILIKNAISILQPQYSWFKAFDDMYQKEYEFLF